MLHQIERNDTIFQSPLFNRDTLAFSIILSIVENKERYPNPKVFSNNKDCIVVNSDSEHPVIVWTADDFKDYEPLYDFLIKEFSKNNPFKFMSKKRVFDVIKNKQKGVSNRTITNATTLGVYSCQSLNEITYAGHPDNVTLKEVSEVAHLYALFYQETGIDKNSTTESCMMYAEAFVTSPVHQVWRNNDNKIVAIACVRQTDKYDRIGHVLTVPEERGKSYAKMLVHFLTQQALDKGKIPMLFTDFDYVPSNKCYCDVGYKLNCTIVEYEIQKK